MSLGSAWRKWDLHVHTPDSFVHSYPGSDPWDKFLEDLKHLPPELGVIGINDYLFVDGFERVRKEKESGNLPNLQTVFPVIEFRLRELIGVEGHLARINLHVLFSEDTKAESIQAQFINGLSTAFHLESDHKNVTWAGFPTRENLEQLGKAIRENSPPEKQKEFPATDVQLGFNNLVVEHGEIRKLLTTPLWQDSHLVALGKNEWASMKWTAGSIAVKKDIINGADAVLVAAEHPAAYMAAKESLEAAGVNSKLLDCSDAHHLSSSNAKDRLGNCFTWINADPTFHGLRHALREFPHRVKVGEEPPKLGRIRQRPSFHVESISVRKTADASNEPHGYFDVTLELNPGFVAVIGNKGKGKSALLDVLGLLGNSSNEREFTFLSADRFRNPLANRARSYEARLTWLSGESEVRCLNAHVQDGSVERIAYLPQQLIDSICDPDPGPPAARFSQELGNVLFAHVPSSERLGAGDLETLISMKSKAIESKVAALRTELSLINQEIASLERKGTPARRKALETELADLQAKLQNLDEKPPPKPQEVKSDNDETVALRQRLEQLEREAEDLTKESGEIEADLARLAKEVDAGTQLITSIETIRQQFSTFLASNSERAALLGLDLQALVQLVVETTPIEDRLAAVNNRRSELLKKLDPDLADSLPARTASVIAARVTAASQLDLPAREYERAKKTLAEWEAARRDLMDGTTDQRGIKGVEEALAEIDEFPALIGSAVDQRREKVRETHAALGEIVQVFSDLYGPARDFIESHPLATKANLEFGAALREKNLEDKLWSIVGRNKAGTFLGVDEASSFVRNALDSADFSDAESTLAFVDLLDRALHFDLRSEGNPPVEPESALRTGRSLEEVYDLIFGLSYLEPYYMLRYSGVPIDRLSPGEKGTLLLMFYLLVDPSDKPLLLDQPDENLDNQTIKELLVPALKEAKERRQVVVVTHNPNVAVVADADQVIVADFDGDRFLYASGAIEDPLINAKIVDVLEGTWPAFENREFKYQVPVT